MVPKGKCAIKHYAHTLLVANVSNERLGSFEIISCRTDMSRIRRTRCTIAPFLYRKNTTKFYGICCQHP
jgi:hypothetical protein